MFAKATVKNVIVLLLSFGLGRCEYEVDERLNIVHYTGKAVLVRGERSSLFCVGTEPGMEWVDNNGTVVGRRAPNRHVHVEETLGKLVLMFDDPRLSDTGPWMCRAGNIEQSINIYVVEEVSFEDTKPVETPVEGRDVTLACAAHSFPPAKLVWYRNDVEMKAITNPKKYDVWEGKLVIHGVSREDSGYYECRAFQNYIEALWNHTASRFTKVLVRHPPVMQQGSVQEVHVLYDHIRILRCQAKAFPKPIYRWTRLRNSEKTIPDYSGDIYTARNGTYSDLTVRVNGLEDLGFYACYAKNPLGYSKTMFHLIKGKKPNPPTKVDFKNATNNSLIFEVNCGNCTEITNNTITPAAEVGYRFELMQQEKKRKHADLVPVYWERDHEKVLTVDVLRDIAKNMSQVKGLTSNTTYLVRVATFNLAGPSEFVELTQQFSTETNGKNAVTCSVTFIVASFVLAFLT